MKLFSAVFVLLLAAPAVARAESARLDTREVPLRGGRTLAAAPAQEPFELVGLQWRGPGTVQFRTRSVSGRWSAWRGAAPESEDRPDSGGRERSVPGWRLGNPFWVGRSNRLEIRTRGRVMRVRAHYVRSSAAPAPLRTLTLAQAPPIVMRSAWGASESRRDPIEYAPSVRLAVVHHTAGANGYSRAEAPAIVRGIQTYHVRGNGWNDIGYNFLVDRYGQVFEGRAGGITRNVVGAHAEGFNDGTVGVAVLGSYGSTRISAAAQAAIAKLIAWRLDVAHVDPLALPTYISNGNPRYPRGAPVIMRGVVGHRETGFTSCPGDALMGQLAAIARGAWSSGLPKVFDARVQGTLGGRVRLTARLSASLPWTATVTDSARNVVASGTATSDLVDWTWDATGVEPGTYTWSITTAGARAATGLLRSRTVPVVSIAQLKAAPASFTPNADGHDDTTAVSYVLGARATVTASLYDAAGTLLATLFSQSQGAGKKRFVFAAENVPDGTYRIELVAVDARGKVVRGQVSLLISRTLSRFAATRPAFSPNGDGMADRITFRFALAVPAEVKLRMLRRRAWVVTPFEGPLGAGAHEVPWDGRKRIGRAADGPYEAEITLTDHVGTAVHRIPFAVDTRPPRLVLVSRRPLRLRVDEPGELVTQVAARRIVVKVAKAGVHTVPGVSAPAGARVVAWDVAGNRSRPLRVR